jgi:hypothetical protein
MYNKQFWKNMVRLISEGILPLSENLGKFMSSVEAIGKGAEFLRLRLSNTTPYLRLLQNYSNE